MLNYVNCSFVIGIQVILRKYYDKYDKGDNKIVSTII